MTLSLSPFVRSSVRPFFFLLVSLKFSLVLKSLNGVLRLFKGCLKFKGSFKDVSSKFQGNFKGVARKVQGCFN